VAWGICSGTPSKAPPIRSDDRATFGTLPNGDHTHDARGPDAAVNNSRTAEGRNIAWAGLIWSVVSASSATPSAGQAFLAASDDQDPRAMRNTAKGSIII
jgi:hypothetical protein